MNNKDTALEGRVVAFGYFYLTAQNILSTIIGVLGYSFLTRSVSQVDVSALAGLTLLATFLQILSDPGLSSSLAKFVSELRDRDEGTASYLISAITFRGVIASTLSLLLLLIPEWFSTTLFKTTTYSPAIRLLSLDLLLISLTPLLSSFFLGAGRLKAIAFCGVASTSARWAAIVLLLLKGFGIQGVVLGWILGDLLALALYSISVSRSGALGNLAFNFTQIISKLLGFSIPLYAASLISFLYSYYDRTIILALLPLSDLGVYDVASKVLSVLVAFTTPPSSALFPYYGSAYGRSEHNSEFHNNQMNGIRYLPVATPPTMHLRQDTSEPTPPPQPTNNHINRI
jgi:O-antigen/teichoic acid export membrane protein